jgi:predicted MPP superfamily phosphohydrolase
MKICSTGDIHGRDYWKYEDYSKFDKVIFVGDYVDSFDIDGKQQYINLFNIINFKKDNMNGVVLLWGNHDIHYYKLGKHKCIGFNEKYAKDFNELFVENQDLFQLSYQIDNYVWTHAGIHRGWWDMFIKDKNKIQEGENVADTLNRLFKENYEPIFHCGIWRSGRHHVGGPLWLDKNEATKPIVDYHQIVGHNILKDRKIQCVSQNFKGDTSITFIDTENCENYELEI